MNKPSYNTYDTATENQTQTKGDTSLPSSAEELQALMDLDSGTYSVEDFFRMPEKTDFQISPNGEYFSYMAPHKGRLNIHIQKIGSDEAQAVTDSADRDLHWYLWADDNRLLYFKDSGGDENFKLYAVDKDGSNAKDLTPFDGVNIELVDKLHEVDDEIIISMNKENPQLFEPYRLNIRSGELQKLAENKDPMKPITGWLTDHEGKLRVAAQMTDGINANLLYRPTEEDEWQTVVTTNFKQTIAPLLFDFDNGPVIYANSNLGRDKQAIVRYNLETAEEEELLFGHPEVDIEALSFSRKRKVLTYISYVVDKVGRHFLDEQYKNIFKSIAAKLPEYQFGIVSRNKAEDKLLVRSYSDRSLGAYFLYDVSEDKLTKLVDVSPWLDENDMAEMKPVEFEARDGLKLRGYLTLPKGSDGKNLSAVLNPHGGPWARDIWGYNPEVQLLANRGYAVLQVNFRTSTGFGRKFWEAGFKQWGQKLQDDLTDGVNWMIDQGIADPKRVAIYGGSYGGYATLCGLTYTPDLYACGVDFVGVSNLFTFLETIPPYWKPYLEMMYEMVGNPVDDKEMMTAYSPALNTEKITSPLLVVQGANDPRVNIDESDQVVKALRARGVEVPYMVKYNEGHGFHNEENRFDFYKAMTGFLAKHLKGLQA